MEQYNFKIVAEFKEPLPQNEIVKLTQIQEKLNIIKINENSYCKSQPIHNYDDLGATALFFNELTKRKDLFKKLEYHDFLTGDVEVVLWKRCDTFFWLNCKQP